MLDAESKGELLKTIMESEKPGFIADFAAASLPNWTIHVEEKQLILETLDVRERLEKVSYFLNREIIKQSSRPQGVKYEMYMFAAEVFMKSGNFAKAVEVLTLAISHYG